MRRSQIIAVLAVPVASAALARQPAGPASNAEPAAIVQIDDRLLNELARRNLPDLLERAFELRSTPEPVRKLLRSRMAAAELKSPGLTPKQRRELIQRIVAGLSAEAIRQIDDPFALAEQAELIVVDGITADVDTLEYWGPTPAAQNAVRPAAEAALMLLDRAAILAETQAARVPLRHADDVEGIAKIERLDALRRAAIDLRQQVAYFFAISLDRADPRRRNTLQAAIDYVRPFDSADNPRQAYVKTFLAKLNMAVGDAESSDTAADLFDDAVAALAAATPREQFEARCFRVINLIQAARPKRARAAFDDFSKWIDTADIDAATRSQWDVARQIVLYRVLKLEADESFDLDEKKTLAGQAAGVLVRLMDARPELRELITRQLAATIEADADLKSLHALMLHAIVGEAEPIVVRTDALTEADRTTLQRAVDAGRELMSRENVDESIRRPAHFLLAASLERLDRRIDAATVYLDFAERYRNGSLELATAALSNAQRLVGLLRRESPDDAAVVGLVDRVFPLAIAEPFNQVDLAFAWAVRLQALDRHAEAIEFLRRVPRDSPDFDAAQFATMSSLAAILAATPQDDPRHDSIVIELSNVIDQVRQQAMRSDDAQSRRRFVSASLVGADLALTEQNDPARAMKLLDGFESRSAGVAGADALNTSAKFVRVNALIRLGRADEAVDAMLSLLDNGDTRRAGQTMADLLERIDADLDRAQADGDEPRAKLLIDSRARLTPRLVAWADATDDPAVASLRYRYRVYNAESQRLAATLKPGEQREAALQNALTLFESLDAPEGFEQFVKSLAESERPAAKYDRVVALGMARIHFDLGNLEQSRDRFGRLLVDRELGPPIIARRDAAGNEVQVDNDIYWEAVYKWIKSATPLADDREPFRRYLREQYVRWSDRVGGVSWRDEFESLRRELIPDFDPKSTGR